MTMRRFGLLRKENAVLKSITVPRQKNGSDCGICILENIEQILFKSSVLNDFKDSPNKCKLFTHFLTNRRPALRKVNVLR